MDIITKKHEGWAELILNRPERRNAITGPMGEALASEIRTLDSDEDVNVILFRGAEGAFCSGMDLKELFADPPPVWLNDFSNIWRDVHTALYDCKKPIICALERFGIHAGAALALACDLLITGENAYLKSSEARDGDTAPYILAWLALRHSEAVGMRLVLTARPFMGKELLDLGIANELIADDAVLMRSSELAAELASFPAGSLVDNKRILKQFHAVSAQEWFDRAFNQAS